MILKTFPDLQWLKKQAESSFENRQDSKGQTLPRKGWPTVLLNVETSRTFRDNIRGPLSIFTNISGESSVEVNKKKVKVSQGFFFVTNHDQYYTLSVDECRTETFNIHFAEYFADQLYQSYGKPDNLLDAGYFIKPSERIEFNNNLYAKSNAFDAILRTLLEDEDALLREERLAELMAIMLDNRKDHLKRMEAIPSLKNSTREEIMKRLLLAADYIHSFYHTDISLDVLADTCCLSKFHFLRLFKIAFGKTPHQYLNEVRMTRAKSLLKNRKIEIGAITPLVGLRDQSSFSRMFYRHAGVYPGEFRKQIL
jgi:AraC family transcriptional regulator